MARAGAPGPVNAIGVANIAPAIMTLRHGRAAGALPAPDAARRRDLEPGDVRARGRLRPRLAPVRGGASTATTSSSTGRRRGTRNGDRADWCQLYVRTNPDVAEAPGASPACSSTCARRASRPGPITDDGGRQQLQRAVPHRRAGAALGPCSATVDEGWNVATRTLSNERAGVASLYLAQRAKLDRLLEAVGPDRSPVARDAVVRRYIEARTLELLAKRTLGAALSGRPAGPGGQRDQAGVVASPTRRWPPRPSTSSGIDALERRLGHATSSRPARSRSPAARPR